MRRPIMKAMNRRSMIRITAVAFLAAALLPAFVAAQEAQTPPPAAKERPARILAREALDLTPEQEKTLAEFRKARAEESRAFRDEMRKLRTELRGLARDPQANRAQLDSLIDRSARLRAEREKAVLRNRAERQNIFTPEQIQKLKALRQRPSARPRLARLRAFRHRLQTRRWR
jgi:Spy/CpxP family protein refolding chaperone